MRPLAAALVDGGWSVTVPDGRRALSSPAHFVAAALDGCTAADVVVGHSGAGAVLPVAAATVGAVAVYVDAVVPPVGGAGPEPAFLALLDGLATDADGLLPPWDRWWPAAVLVDLVPDATARAEIVAELPRLPRRFYDVAPELPPAWWTRPAAYLQLSPAYAAERSRAAELGWPTAHVPGRHLDPAVHPERVARAVRRLVAPTAGG